MSRLPPPALLLLAALLLPALHAQPEPVRPAAAPTGPTVPPAGNRVWEARLNGFDTPAYAAAFERLLADFEVATGRPARPGRTGQVALKLYTGSGAGLSTPPELVRAVVAALRRRGFAAESILLFDQNESRLREAGFLPPLSVGGTTFEGLSVRILEGGRFWDRNWFYDSPQPAGSVSTTAGDFLGLAEPRESVGEDRLSFLPYPLLFEVDFWINLPAAGDHPAWGVNGALANATVWNASNTQRFARSSVAGPAAVAEMAAIPELRLGWIFTVVSLERWQFIGGPVFNSLYTRSEPLLWLSDNPVLLDALLAERITAARRSTGFAELPSDLRLLTFAESLGVGPRRTAEIDWRRP